MTGGSAIAACAVAAAQPDRIVVGIIGSGGRGTNLMAVFQKNAGVRVGAISDVYEPNLERALTAAAKVQGSQPKSYRDYKALLDDKEITAVVIATPDHWHHRMVLDALAAGKDVYVEKPLCQTPEQGVELVDAGKRSDRVVQVGMQRRSYDLYIEGRKLVAAGALGNVRMVRSWWLNNHVSAPANVTLDGHLDWERWQGPARRHALDPYRFRQWRFFSDYAGGIVADQGAHVFDGMHLLMGAGYPLAVTAAAGKPHKPRVDTPESVVVISEYPEDFVGVFTINYAAMRYQTRHDQLNQLDGDQARMDIGREELTVFRQGAEDTPALRQTSATGFARATDVHVENFLQCIRSRKTPAAPVEVGFQSALVVQMANLSLKHGRRIRWNAALRRTES